MFYMEDMANEKFIIEIAGSVASGKTSLAKAFAERVSPVLSPAFEDLSTNPFITSSSIKNKELHAFCTQMSFMLSKFYQRAHTFETSTMGIISDYSLFHEPGYHDFWTKGKFQGLAQALLGNWRSMKKEIQKPDCIVLLKTSVKEQRRRIQERGRPFEQKLWTHANLTQLNRALADSFNEHVPNTIPVITLRSADIDLNDKQQLDTLWKQISKSLDRPQHRTPVIRNG